MNCIICNKHIHVGKIHGKCRKMPLEEDRGEILRRREGVKIQIELIESIMLSPISQYRVNGPVEKR